MARRSRSAASSTISVDFTGVESRVLLPEGEMLFEVTEVTKEKSESSGDDMLVWNIEVAEGKLEGTSGPRIYTSLSENALWKLAGLLTALGVEVPDGPLDIDLTEMVGAQFMGVVTHEEYNQRMQARINDFYSAEDAPPAEEEKPARGRRSRREEPEEEAEEEKPTRSRRGRAAAKEDEPEERSSRRSRRGAKDEDEKPAARGRRGRAKELEPMKEDDIHDMNEGELEALNDEYGLDADLESARTLRKKAALIIDALEEKDLLDTGK